MNEETAPGTQDRVATMFGWAIAITFFVLFWNIIMLPRTPLDQRANLQMFHDSLGLIVMLLAWARLVWFVLGPRPTPPVGLPDAAFAFNRTILFAIVLTFAVTGFIGFFYAWGEGRQIYLFGVHFPQLLPTTEGLRKTTGYPHSALSFYYLMLFALWFAVGIYQHFRYRTGYRRLFPGARV